MSNLNQHDIARLCGALCRQPTVWVDIRGQPSGRLIAEEADRIIRLPKRVLQHPSSSAHSSSSITRPSLSSSIPKWERDPNMCLVHGHISHMLISSLSARILHEVALKLPLLDAAVAAMASWPKPGHSGSSPHTAAPTPWETVKPKHVKSLMRLQKSYKRIYAYLLPPGAGKGAHVGGCEGCFVAAFGGCEEALFALRTGARVWSHDRSAVGRYVAAWYRLLPADVREILEEDIPRVAHGTRRVMRAIAAAAAGDGGGCGGGGAGGGGDSIAVPTQVRPPPRTGSRAGVRGEAPRTAAARDAGEAGGRAVAPVLAAHLRPGPGPLPERRTEVHAGWEAQPAGWEELPAYDHRETGSGDGSLPADHHSGEGETWQI